MFFSNPAYTINEFLYKENYELVKLYCDTYSLTEDKLVELAAAVCIADETPHEESSLADLCLSFNIKKCSDRLVVHSHFIPYPCEGQTAISQNAKNVWAECGISAGKIARINSYHPKLLLACFRNGGDYFYRLQVGTANLTGSSAINLAVIVEGNHKKTSQDANGAILREFYSLVYGGTGNLPDELQKLDQVSFQAASPTSAPVQIDNITFAYTFGSASPNNGNNLIKNRIKNEMSSVQGENPPSIKVYSPFLRPENGGKFYLDTLGISAEYYTNLTKEIAKNWDKIKSRCRYSSNANLFLHAKVYSWDKKDWCRRMWLGSANASKNGWVNNAEFMIGFDLTLKIPIPSDINKYDNLTYKAAANQIDVQAQFCNTPDPSDDLCHATDEKFLIAKQIMQGIAVEENKTPTSDLVCLHSKLQLNSADFLRGHTFCARLWDRSREAYSLLTGDNCNCWWYLPSINTPLFGAMDVEIEVDGESYSFVAEVSKHDKGLDSNGNVMSMVTLLNEIKAIDAIPGCSQRDFSKKEDHVYERLCAYMASYGHRYSKDKILERIGNIKSALGNNQSKYMTKEEQEKLDRLENALK